MRTFVIADIHGQHKALVECLAACGFDRDNDRLIVLGDVCDRGPKVRECIDELLTIRRLVFVLGNHDAWALDWAARGLVSKDWMEQGGAETVVSYKGIGMPKEHIALLARAPLYFEEGKRLFVHAGFDADRGVKATPNEMILWNRGLLGAAIDLNRSCPEWKFGEYDEIFVGHTPTQVFDQSIPFQACNVWALDTGAGYDQMLTIMDVDTKQYWQAKC